MEGVDPARVETIDAGDCRFAVTLLGRGAPVVFLHGLSANRSMWAPVLERLPAGLLAIVPDLPGRGDTRAPPDARFRLTDEADRLQTLMDRLDVDVPVVVGHSHGAAIAVLLADRGRSSGLLLTAPVPPDLRRPVGLSLLGCRPVAGVTARVARLFRRPLTRYILERRVYAERSRVDAELVDRYSAPFAALEQAESLLRALADWRPGDLAPVAVPLRVPVTVLAGGRDRRIPVRSARAWAQCLGAHFEALSEVGHALPEEAPDEVANRLERRARAAGRGGRDHG